MKTVTNCFVLNLAAADLLFTLSIPAVAYTRFVPSWKLGNIACRLIPYTQVINIQACKIAVILQTHNYMNENVLFAILYCTKGRTFYCVIYILFCLQISLLLFIRFISLLPRKCCKLKNFLIGVLNYSPSKQTPPTQGLQ